MSMTVVMMRCTQVVVAFNLHLGGRCIFSYDRDKIMRKPEYNVDS